MGTGARLAGAEEAAAAVDGADTTGPRFVAAAAAALTEDDTCDACTAALAGFLGAAVAAVATGAVVWRRLARLSADDPLSRFFDFLALSSFLCFLAFPFLCWSESLESLSLSRWWWRRLRDRLREPS